MMKNALVAVATLFFAGCVGMPENVTPVKGFELERYLGKWYEIARLDHSFERGLQKVTAEYSRQEGGGVTVVNRGYSAQQGKWKGATGKAYFVGDPNDGYLKVSFFGPFYGAYVIFELDLDGYQHALISGPNLSYLWLLARKPELEPEIVARLLRKASSVGFDTDKLIFVQHD